MIEFVIIIIVLGLLVVAVSPKFIDIKSDSENASLLKVKAAIENAMMMVHAKSSIKGNQQLRRMPGVNVEINGVILDIKHGYPLADYSGSNGSWDVLIDLDEEFKSVIIGGHFIVYRGENTPTTLNEKCTVDYRQAGDIATPPRIVLTAC
ncbi:hypothetical protein Q8W26_07260 [Psychrobium sp. 1_MG-2023]|nr:hypothetical protein [Psychrobium sp. 1_MG-2023]MDP2560947.1 hypothetical protein [Psychrobium sp. 1_MG-2023]PKF56019.1 hypothetical protein CW748_11410 [Alteromonadales bacterium alter-6D02]